MYSPSGHPRCFFSFFNRTDLEKCSITSLAHQWILCSEWVPSEWESKQLIKTVCFLQTCSFSLYKTLIDELESFGLLCLDSHSDGTHSLQRIHWWASDVMLHFYKSDEETNSSTSWMVWGWLHFQQNVIFGWTIHLRSCEQGGRTTKTLNCKLTLQDHFSDIWHHANKCGTLEAIILSKWKFCRHLHEQRLQNLHFLL